jgi:GxxExxY protein
MAELVYPDLSYKIMGVLYRVYNQVGGGYQEKIYQKAVKAEFVSANIGFLDQVKVDLFYNSKQLHKYYLDFIVEHKIVLELKTASFFSHRDIIQVLNYLKQADLPLGILVSFSRNGLKYKRILKGSSYLS